MAKEISYGERYLGKIRHDDDASGRVVFVAESLESLISFFGVLTRKEELTINGESIPYSEFETNYLPEISAFYKDNDSWRNKSIAFERKSKETLHEKVGI